MKSENDQFEAVETVIMSLSGWGFATEESHRSRKKKTEPHAVGKNQERLYDFQEFIRKQGVETHWPGEKF